MARVRNGRLRPPDDAPATGELSYELVRHGAGAAGTGAGAVVIEQILSGEVTGPAHYLQDHDEWVAVLAGGAVLDVADERLELGAGDWVLLPADVPHRVVETAPGTSWLAVHLPR